jgi:hypothetical protein
MPNEVVCDSNNFRPSFDFGLIGSRASSKLERIRKSKQCAMPNYPTNLFVVYLEDRWQ